MSAVTASIAVLTGGMRPGAGSRVARLLAGYQTVDNDREKPSDPAAHYQVLFVHHGSIVWRKLVYAIDRTRHVEIIAPFHFPD
jgi:hypothetical protein